MLNTHIIEFGEASTTALMNKTTQFCKSVKFFKNVYAD